MPVKTKHSFGDMKMSHFSIKLRLQPLANGQLQALWTLTVTLLYLFYSAVPGFKNNHVKYSSESICMQRNLRLSFIKSKGRANTL